MKKLISLLTASFLAVSLMLPNAGLAASETTYKLGATANPDHVTLTWTQDPTTSQTITWRTDPSIRLGMVEYAKAQSNGLAEISVAKEQTFATDLGDMELHSVTLSNLEPGTTYTYRVGDGQHWSEVHTFTTEKKDDNHFKFLIFGDSQSGDPLNPEYGPWQKTVQNAFKANPDARFFVNVGDLVEWGQSYVHWNNWFDAAKGVIDTIPAMPAQGNHETYNPPDWHTTKPVFWTSQFNLPQNGPDGLKGQAYSFDYGNAHIIMLDSQEEEEKPVAGDILEAQKKWLENDLKNTDKTWKIVFFHKTPYYNKATRTNEDIKAAFQPIFDKYHVDIVFNGHDHSIARTYPIYNDQFVDSTAKGTVYYVTGRSGNKYYPDLSAKVWNDFFYDPQDQPNYITAEVIGHQLKIMAVKQDGTVVDSYTIDKDNPGVTAIPPKYNNTRLTIYGNMLQSPLLSASPVKIDGKWYVPIRSFIHFLGGSAYSEADKEILQYGKVTVKLQPKSLTAVSDGTPVTLPDPVLTTKEESVLLSADSITTLYGLKYKFDENMNMLLFTK